MNHITGAVDRVLMHGEGGVGGGGGNGEGGGKLMVRVGRGCKMGIG